MAAAAKYLQEDGGDADPPTKVCAEAGRRCVKNIRQHPILSPEWIQLVDSFRQLTRLVMVEGRMPVNTKVSEAHGRNTDGGTLWDQEAHENAIRILVEEAKVNLCLRLINDFKKWQYDPDQVKATMTSAQTSHNYPEVHLENATLQFEESLGLLLARAFTHVETLQLMDIPLLIEHVHLVLDHSSRLPDDPAARGTKHQETIVLYYYSSLMKHAEALNNGELLAKSRELQLVKMVTDHVLKNETALSHDVITAIAEGMSALAYNEDFSSDWEPFFPSHEDKQNFLLLEEKVANVVLASSPERKKDLRPLLDFFNKIKRKM